MNISAHIRSEGSSTRQKRQRSDRLRANATQLVARQSSENAGRATAVQSAGTKKQRKEQDKIPEKRIKARREAAGAGSTISAQNASLFKKEQERRKKGHAASGGVRTTQRLRGGGWEASSYESLDPRLNYENIKQSLTKAVIGQMESLDEEKRKDLEKNNAKFLKLRSELIIDKVSDFISEISNGGGVDPHSVIKVFQNLEQLLQTDGNGILCLTTDIAYKTPSVSDSGRVHNFFFNPLETIEAEILVRLKLSPAELGQGGDSNLKVKTNDYLLASKLFGKQGSDLKDIEKPLNDLHQKACKLHFQENPQQSAKPSDESDTGERTSKDHADKGLRQTMSLEEQWGWYKGDDAQGEAPEAQAATVIQAAFRRHQGRQETVEERVKEAAAEARKQASKERKATKKAEAAEAKEFALNAKPEPQTGQVGISRKRKKIRSDEKKNKNREDNLTIQVRNLTQAAIKNVLSKYPNVAPAPESEAAAQTVAAMPEAEAATVIQAAFRGHQGRTGKLAANIAVLFPTPAELPTIRTTTLATSERFRRAVQEGQGITPKRLEFSGTEELREDILQAQSPLACSPTNIGNSETALILAQNPPVPTASTALPRQARPLRLWIFAVAVCAGGAIINLTTSRADQAPSQSIVPTMPNFLGDVLSDVVKCGENLFRKASEFRPKVTLFVSTLGCCLQPFATSRGNFGLRFTYKW